MISGDGPGRCGGEERAGRVVAGGVVCRCVCGVWANIGNFDDARFDPDRDWKRKLARECGTERLIVFAFDPPREPERAEVGDREFDFLRLRRRRR